MQQIIVFSKANAICLTFLLIFITNSCLLSQQQNGKCTECLSMEYLQNGHCYPKIQACFNQHQSKCLECQNTYILIEGTCTKYFEKSKETTLNSEQPKIQDQPIDQNVMPKNISLENSSIQNLGGAQSIQDIQINPITTNDRPQNFTFQKQLSSQKSGAYQLVSVEEYNSEVFLSVVSTIKKSIPSFSVELIRSVAKQIVAGQNYLISFSYADSDIYELQVFVPLSHTVSSASIIKLTKNGLPSSIDSLISPSSSNSSISSKTSSQSLSSEATRITAQYFWQSDKIFLQLYKFFKSQIKISNLPPIVQVNKFQKILNDNPLTKFYEYNIIYSTDEHALCRYYTNFNLFEVISYVRDEIELYSSAKRISVKNITEKELIEKINQYNHRAVVKQIGKIKLSDHFDVYTVDFYDQSGHYEAVILDKGQLFVIKLSTIDNLTCFTVNQHSNNFLRQQHIDQVIKFIFIKYNLSAFSLTSAMVNVVDSQTTSYVILLTRDDLKKVKITFEEMKNRLTIKKIEVLYDGFYVLKNESLAKQNEVTARKQYEQQLEGYDTNLVMTNGTATVINFSNESKLAIYTKSSQQVLPTLTKNQFRDPNECQIKGVQNLIQTCIKCRSDNILWKGKCYTQVTNCAIQVGSQCIACDKFSFYLNGKCLKNCTDIFTN